MVRQKGVVRFTAFVVVIFPIMGFKTPHFQCSTFMLMIYCYCGDLLNQRLMTYTETPMTMLAIVK